MLHSDKVRMKSLVTHSVLIISNIREDVIEIQDATITVLQAMNLYPVAWILIGMERNILVAAVK